MASNVGNMDLPQTLKGISEMKHDVVDANYFKNIADTCDFIVQRSTSDSRGCKFDIGFAKSVDRILLNSLRPKPNCDPRTVTQCVANLFRACRNLCAMCPTNQDVLSTSTLTIATTCVVVNHKLESGLQDEDSLVLTRCAVQFLGNFASGKKKNQQEIWNKTQGLLLKLLQQTVDQKLKEYIMVVIHICIEGIAPSLESPPIDHPTWQLVCAIIKYAVEEDTSNGLIVCEDFWKMEGFSDKVFQKLDKPSRLLVLEVLINTLKRLPEDVAGVDVEFRDAIPTVQNLEFVVADFILQSHLIPQMTNNQNEALCTVKELEAICLATAHHTKYGELQDNPQLVKSTIGLLQSIQELGKEGNNVFANVEKMSQQGQVDPNHPVFGLKRDLIRLLGNMAYKNKKNQDLVRELEGLPLIMEQTNIDGKNPFITQWSVFALHNLTEENEENRLYIANLRLQGVANNQAVLNEMGLQAETEGDKVKVEVRKGQEGTSGAKSPQEKKPAAAKDNDKGGKVSKESTKADIKGGKQSTTPAPSRGPPCRGKTGGSFRGQGENGVTDKLPPVINGP